MPKLCQFKSDSFDLLHPHRSLFVLLFFIFLFWTRNVAVTQSFITKTDWARVFTVLSSFVLEVFLVEVLFIFKQWSVIIIDKITSPCLSLSGVIQGRCRDTRYSDDVTRKRIKGPRDSSNELNWTLSWSWRKSPGVRSYKRHRNQQQIDNRTWAAVETCHYFWQFSNHFSFFLPTTRSSLPRKSHFG